MLTDGNISLHEIAVTRSEHTSNRWVLVGIVVFGFSLGFSLLGPYVPAKLQAESVPSIVPADLPPVEPSELLLPNASLSPEQVVDAQMRAMAAYRDDRRAIHQVFAFASPANRSMTGPIGRFERMILRPPYHLLVVSEHWIAGRVVRRDGQATRLVTTVSAQGRVSLFRFYLSLQSDDFEDCWMTDRVVSLFRGEFGREGELTAEMPPIDAI